MAEGKFREDRFFRLGVVVLQVPSLASRVEDIPALVRHFQRRMPADAKCRYDAGAMALLMQHAWPGNVSELRNFVERASVLHGGETLGAEDVAMLLNPTAAFAPRYAVPGSPAAVSASAEDFAAAPLASAAPTAKTPAPGHPIDLKREIEKHGRSEEHTSELQSLMRISYAVFCLKKKKVKQ